MASFKALCLAGVASLVATAAASAADLPLPAPPPIYTPPPQPVSFGSGWYLRGDVGEGNLLLRDGQSTFAPDYSYGTANGLPPGFTRQGENASAQATAGLGVGYQVNAFFRADVTGEYRFGSNYDAHEGYAFGSDNYNGKISNGLVLVNGYVDLGTWNHVTPYVGAGVGAAFNRFSSIVDSNASYYNKPSGQSDANEKTSFAYAFMAGLSYDLTRNLKLDFGYRFVSLGGIQSGAINCYGGTRVCGDNSREVQSYHLYSNDIRVGLRYTLADFAPIGPAPVLISKY